MPVFGRTLCDCFLITLVSHLSLSFHVAKAYYDKEEHRRTQLYLFEACNNISL